MEKKWIPFVIVLLSADLSGVDWPLVLGSFAAVVLFLCSVAVVAVVVHRKGTNEHAPRISAFSVFSVYA